VGEAASHTQPLNEDRPFTETWTIRVGRV